MADLHLHPTSSRPIGQHLLHTDSQISSETHVWQPTDLALEDVHGKPASPLDAKENAASSLEDDWEHDPMNARNWPSSKKWTAVCIVSFYTLIPPLASSMMAPGLPEIAAKYGVTDTVTTALILSVFLISFAIGPLFMAPMSEMYGRTWVCFTSYLHGSLVIDDPFRHTSGSTYREYFFPAIQPRLCLRAQYRNTDSVSLP